MKTLEVMWVILFLAGAYLIGRHPRLVMLLWLLGLATWRKRHPPQLSRAAQIRKLEEELGIIEKPTPKERTFKWRNF